MSAAIAERVRAHRGEKVRSAEAKLAGLKAKGAAPWKIDAAAAELAEARQALSEWP